MKLDFDVQTNNEELEFDLKNISVVNVGGVNKGEVLRIVEDALTSANNYTNDKVDQAVTDINTKSIAPLQAQVDVHDRSIAGFEEEIEQVKEIAKGTQRGVAYESYYDMVVALNGGDKSLLNLHQSVYIGTENVPDLWVYAIADTPKQYTYTSEETFANNLIKNKSVQVGYFIFKRLEFGKVDLENYYTKTETDDKLEEAIAASQVKIVRLI